MFTILAQRLGGTDSRAGLAGGAGLSEDNPAKKVVLQIIPCRLINLFLYPLEQFPTGRHPLGVVITSPFGVLCAGGHDHSGGLEQ